MQHHQRVITTRLHLKRPTPNNHPNRSHLGPSWHPGTEPIRVVGRLASDECVYVSIKFTRKLHGPARLILQQQHPRFILESSSIGTQTPAGQLVDSVDLQQTVKNVSRFGR